MTASKIFAGASGYSYKEWKSHFYPEDIKPNAMLAYYAERLPTVEINNTFYRMPKKDVLENWASSTPKDFRFAIKASRRITHMARLKADEADDSVAYLYKNLAALGAGRGPVLFQLPPFLKKDLPRLTEFLGLLPKEHRAAFEFRNDTWFSDDVYDALKSTGTALVLSEREDNEPPPLVETAPWGYVRASTRNLLGRRPKAVGGPARGYRLARNLRLLHARTDGAEVCAGADAVRIEPHMKTYIAKSVGPLPVSIAVDDTQRVSALLQTPRQPRACYVLAHGAGAGMAHPFMSAVADRLARRGIATLRYQFPYMERGSKRPDAPGLAQATVRAAVAEASRLAPGLALFAGGKSYGGRMTSQAHAEAPLPEVHGLVFLGFPLHPPGRPSEERGKHLFDVQIPMLFLQGSRDEFADLQLLEPLLKQLGARATLKLFADADHSFHVPARTGRKDSQVTAEIVDAIADWIESVM